MPIKKDSYYITETARKRFRRWLFNNELSFNQFSKRCGVSRQLLDRVIKGERFHPATRSLWFYNSEGSDCSAQWYGQWNSGRYKSHCFYSPVESENCY